MSRRARSVLLLLHAVHSLGGSLPPDFGSGLSSDSSDSGAHTYTDWATLIRTAKARGDDSGYDCRVPPSTVRRLKTDGSQGEGTGPLVMVGTDVDVEIRVFKIEEVQLATSFLDLKVWVRLGWRDPRLAWEPSEFGNVTEVFYAAHDTVDLEQNEIWTPDFTLYNAREHDGLGNSLESALAHVSSDGSVFWSRPGSLKALCKFTDIINFPNDKPACKMEIGGWALSGKYQGIRNFLVDTEMIDDVGRSSNNSNMLTASASYATFAITRATSELRQYNYEYEHSKLGYGEAWPIVLLTIDMRRVNTLAWIFLMVMPTMLLAYLATIVAMLPPDCGERLGYGITLVVALEVGKVRAHTHGGRLHACAHTHAPRLRPPLACIGIVCGPIPPAARACCWPQVVLVGVVPIAGEVLIWDLITMVSVVTCYASVFESCLVLFLYNHRDEHILPAW